MSEEIECQEKITRNVPPHIPSRCFVVPTTRRVFIPIPSAMATRSALSRVAPTLLKARSHALPSKVSRAAFLAARGYASEAGHTVSPLCPNEATQAFWY